MCAKGQLGKTWLHYNSGPHHSGWFLQKVLRQPVNPMKKKCCRHIGGKRCHQSDRRFDPGGANIGQISQVRGQNSAGHRKARKQHKSVGYDGQAALPKCILEAFDFKTLISLLMFPSTSTIIGWKVGICMCQDQKAISAIFFSNWPKRGTDPKLLHQPA